MNELAGFTLGPEVIAPVSSITPTSLFGWGGFVFGLVACGVLLWDRIVGRGRTNANLETAVRALGDDLKDMVETQKVMDSHLDSLSTGVRDLTHEVKGVDGLNGIKGLVKQHDVEIKAIHKRNQQMDILAAIYQRELDGYDGPERRQSVRRLKDAIKEEEGNG